ncbi:MAG: P1 family peptidase [Candidatus Handelsmanbacteria bacterium]|nr:P1 family peptidase [Candidatus Handelsmanbacteria bacterium]
MTLGATLQGRLPALAQALPKDHLRLRQLGLSIGSLPTGPLNAITDVPGVRVGQVTLIAGEGSLVIGKGPVRTGVTAILPHGGVLSREPVLAADFTLNGNGELTGVGPLRRTGWLGAPILFTDTGSVGAAYSAALGYMLERDPEALAGAEPVVGETWADFLHDTAGGHLHTEHVRRALEGAWGGPVEEGCTGGGTGMRAYEFKAGTGTSSRLVEAGDRRFAVGVLVQANHGRRAQLMIDGVPVGREIPDLLPERPGQTKSMLAAVATDAPLLPLQLRQLAKRVSLGMARTGGISTHSSGDIFIAFSIVQRRARAGVQPLEGLADGPLTRLYQGVVEATEEAILNSLTMAQTMAGRDGHLIHALPLDRLAEVLRRHGRIK